MNTKEKTTFIAGVSLMTLALIVGLFLMLVAP